MVRKALGSVLLAVVYFGLLVPIALLVRAVRDPLSRDVKPEGATYWQESQMWRP